MDEEIVQGAGPVPAHPGEPEALPLVSCIMPTYNRRDFVSGAIRHFLRQDYPRRELVIVDDGTDAIRDLVPEDPRIQYLRLEGRHRLGAKRNIACDKAAGEVIVHWDDDDWMASWRLTYQVGELLRRKADVCGVDRLFFLDPRSGRAWLYTYPRRRGAWAAGGTLCYTRAFWKRNPFPGIDIGEDSQFLSRARSMRLALLDDHRFYVALVHPRNTSRKSPGRAPWRGIDAAKIRALQAEDETLSGAATPPAPPPVPPAGSAEPAEDLGVTVSMPFRGCPKMLRRAILSVLGQTHGDLTLVVVNDGGSPPWEALADIADPRLVRFDLPVNEGPYFAHEIVLEATGSAYFLEHDADDWSEPHRVASCLRRLRAEAAAGTLSAGLKHSERRDSRPVLETFSRLDLPPTSDFRHRAHHHGLFRCDALKAVGGYYGGFRVGYDTLLINLLLMSGRLAWVKEPLYHRTSHSASLTQASATGARSAARRQAAEVLAKLYREAYSAYVRHRGGSLDHAGLCTALRRIARSRVTPEQQAAIDRETLRLKEVLGRRGQQTSEPVAATGPVSILDAPELPWLGWAIQKDFAQELARFLEINRPRRLLEAGSGSSTVLLADYAARHGASLVSLEHDHGFHERTGSLLRRFGLRDRVDLKLAPLRPFQCAGGACHPWYGVDLAGPFDFVLIDGPPERFGRQAALFAVAPHLSAEWHLWLHDGARPHEQGCVALWRRFFSFSQSTGCEGALLLQGQGGLPRVASPERSLGITLLAGRRPFLLRRTIDALLLRSPGLLERHRVVALLNGDDPETQAYLEGLPFIDEHLRHGSVLPTGTAASLLMETILRPGDVETVLHLEDDWVAEGNGTGWLETAHRILDELPQVGQVRLRHREEKVLAHHMVTGSRIDWKPREGFLLARSAHFTFNPSLIRARDVPAIYPCHSEEEAQRRFLKAGFATAQLIPGVFRHTGAHHSLQPRNRTALRRSRPAGAVCAK